MPVFVRSRAGLSRLVHSTHPFDVVGVGWMRVAVRVLDPRLRADRRCAPPAAAGPPDVRGHGLRRVLVRAASVRLRRRRGEGAVSPCERRLRRGALLLGRRLHEPVRAAGSVSVRCRTTPPGSCTVRSPEASKASRDATADRRGRGDGRHVRAPRGVGRGPCGLRIRTIRGRGRADRRRDVRGAQASTSASTISEPPCRFAWYAAPSARRSKLGHFVGRRSPARHRRWRRPG